MKLRFVSEKKYWNSNSEPFTPISDTLINVVHWGIVVVGVKSLLSGKPQALSLRRLIPKTRRRRVEDLPQLGSGQAG